MLVPYATGERGSCEISATFGNSGMTIPLYENGFTSSATAKPGLGLTSFIINSLCLCQSKMPHRRNVAAAAVDAENNRNAYFE